MVEGRATIKDIEETKKKIKQLGGVVKNYYSFTDIIFIPKIGKINLNKEFIRLRILKVNNWPTKDIILIHKRTDWKGKSKIDNIILRKEFSEIENAVDFIKKHFQNKLKKSFEYYREGWEYYFGKKRIFVEDIKKFKPTVEIEAENEKELDNIFEKLETVERLSDSVPEIMRKKINMIKIIAVDLGGVYFEAGTKIALKKIYKIINVSKEKVDEIFRSYPKKEGELYHKGKITKQKFWEAVVEKLKIGKEKIPELQEIWHSSYRPIEGMKDLVFKLRGNYKVVAFSGNIKERIEYLNKKYKLNEDFDDFVLSFDAGFDKREKEFYRILLEKTKCKLEECLFIDDRQDFLNVAKSLNIKTILFKNAQQLKSDLRKFGVKI